MKGLFSQFGIERVCHYTPMHYLVFIARASALKSKPALIAEGFGPKHFRSMSSTQDVARGFGEFAFLTLDLKPRILGAKLKAGFPHVAVEVPVTAIEATEFKLCRYNVAMTRQLKRGNKSGFPENATNGRYYGEMQIPIAADRADMTAMLEAHYAAGTMIEVLVPGILDLPASTIIGCYSHEDMTIAQNVIRSVNVPWTVEPRTAPGEYNRDARYAVAVGGFIETALADPAWRGNGLEFDRV